MGAGSRSSPSPRRAGGARQPSPEGPDPDRRPPAHHCLRPSTSFRVIPYWLQATYPAAIAQSGKNPNPGCREESPATPLFPSGVCTRANAHSGSLSGPRSCAAGLSKCAALNHCFPFASRMDSFQSWQCLWQCLSRAVGTNASAFWCFFSQLLFIGGMFIRQLHFQCE